MNLHDLDYDTLLGLRGRWFRREADGKLAVLLAVYGSGCSVVLVSPLKGEVHRFLSKQQWELVQELPAAWAADGTPIVRKGVRS